MSMTNFTIPFLKRLKSIALSNNERLMMRERLALYTDVHPYVAGGPVVSSYGGVFSFFSSALFPRYAAAFATLLLVVGGVSNAAEGSAPGDALYALKIQVNEPLMTVLAPTVEGQAKVASSLATRRIDEAVTLAARGELTSERETYLSEEFDSHVVAAAQKTEALENTGNVEGALRVRADFAARLAGEAQALGAVTTSDTTQSAGLLRAVVATSAEISHDTVGARIGLETVTVEDTFEESQEDMATSARESSAALMAQPLAKSAAVGTSSEEQPPPVAKKVRTKTKTAPVRITPSGLSQFNFFLPKNDVAIPKSGAPEGDQVLTTGEHSR